MERIVIIGGVAAGTKIAAKSRRLNPEAAIDIYTEDTHVSYSACGLPFFIEGNFEDKDMLIARTPEEFEADNIHIHLLNRVEKIIPNEKKVLVKNLKTQETFFVEYDKLAVTTGAKPFIPNIKNINVENVFTLRTMEDGIAIKEKIKKVKHAVIIGGGYIGIELLEAFVKQGLNIIMIEYAANIMSVFDEEISHLIKKHILSKDGDRVQIVNSDAVVEILSDNGSVCGVKTSKGLSIQTEMVIVAAGVRPNVDVAVEAGIELGQTGAIKVSQKMETNIKDIYAAGDCVEKNHIVSNTPVWVPLGSTAGKEGRCAALNMFGEEDCFEGILASAVTRYFGMTMSLTGLTEKQALELGFEPISVIVTKLDKVGYMPEAKNITLKLIADKKTHKLLGAQAIGCGDADKRVNTVASGLRCGIDIEHFASTDLTYAPPYSPSMDPLLTAAEKLLAKVKQV